MDGCVQRWMDGHLDERPYGQRDKVIDGWMEGSIDLLNDGLMS